MLQPEAPSVVSEAPCYIAEVSTLRIALANLRFPSSPDDSVALAEDAISQAGRERCEIICFPECFVPGYRAPGKPVPPPDAAFLECAWGAVAGAAAKAKAVVILGTERVVDRGLLVTALVINCDGSFAGFQDKVQLDPSEEGTYCFGESRRIFHAGALTFGIAICHEGWRYPETVRWAARRGAQVVFHPQFHEAEPGGYAPKTFADPANTFQEKAMLCRAAENTCYFASANIASTGSPTTSAVIHPDGTVMCYQPYGKEGLLIADLDLSAATGCWRSGAGIKRRDGVGASASAWFYSERGLPPTPKLMPPRGLSHGDWHSRIHHIT